MICFIRPENPMFRNIDGEWIHAEDVRIFLQSETITRNFTIPEGRPTDLLTLPWWARPFRILFPQGRLTTNPRVVHDELYIRHLLPRKECDLAFLRLMFRYGVNPWRAWLIYFGVRLFGWYWYHFKK